MLKIFILLLLVLTFMGCGVRNSNLIKEYNDFGVKCAKLELWNEAIMRWKRVIEIDPNNAQAYNNLAVAYESKGEFEMALSGYKTAIQIDPDNRIYQINYIKFKRNYEQALKRKENKDSNAEVYGPGF